VHRATSSGIWVICTRRDTIAPMVPPISIAGEYQIDMALCDYGGGRHHGITMPATPRRCRDGADSGETVPSARG